MVRKPNRMYREIKGQAYTRKEYMGGVPPVRVVQFSAGMPGNYPVAMALIAEERCQIRDSAMEAARIASSKYLNLHASGNFYMRILVYPHNVLREHKLATGAGADRVSSGMRAAFGKAVGSAIRVQQKQKLIVIETTPEKYNIAKEALRRASMKIPTPCRIITTKGAELVA